MEPIMLAVDMILTVIIGNPKTIENLLSQARAGDAYFVVLDSALYCALYSVEEHDSKNLSLLAEVLKYSQLQSDAPEYLGATERSSWTPSRNKVRHWRAVALDVDE